MARLHKHSGPSRLVFCKALSLFTTFSLLETYVLEDSWVVICEGVLGLDEGLTVEQQYTQDSRGALSVRVFGFAFGVSIQLCLDRSFTFGDKLGKLFWR